MPKSRRLLAVPFVGKDVPSQSSEFSHPDVVIGLSVLAYRYEGLRRNDFDVVMTALREAMEEEQGHYHKRPSCVTFAKWVQLAGGAVRGWSKRVRSDRAAGGGKRKAEEDDDDGGELMEATFLEDVEKVEKAAGGDDDEEFLGDLSTFLANSMDEYQDMWPLHLMEVGRSCDLTFSSDQSVTISIPLFLVC